MRDVCDKCGRTGELFHNETTGLALCSDCDIAQDAEDEAAKLAKDREDAIRYALRTIRDLADGIFPQNDARKILDDAGTIHNLASLAILSLDALAKDEDEDSDVMPCGCSSGSCYCDGESPS